MIDKLISLTFPETCCSRGNSKTEYISEEESDISFETSRNLTEYSNNPEIDIWKLPGGPGN